MASVSLIRGVLVNPFVVGIAGLVIGAIAEKYLPKSSRIQNIALVAAAALEVYFLIGIYLCLYQTRASLLVLIAAILLICYGPEDSRLFKASAIVFLIVVSFFWKEILKFMFP